jgi:hypothetical protein
MVKKNLDGHTYYYLLDGNNLLHVCSNGKSTCGLDATAFSQVEDNRLIKYEICQNCKELQVTKSATFETKAEIVDEPATGRVI